MKIQNFSQLLDWTTTNYNFDYPNDPYICSKKIVLWKDLQNSLSQVNVWCAPNIFYTSIVFYILKCVLHKQHFTSW